jgi:uncharacterized protein (DUF2235 family)
MKRIAICTDGTWNRPDQEDRGKRKPTNVVKTARGILPSAADGTQQIVFYDDGVGTNWGIDKIAGGGFGIGLSAKIVDAYQFLVLNYEPGDEIFLFGFSRGAYTARSLAGLIGKFGVLPKDHAYYTPDAYKLYRNQAPSPKLDAFKAEHNARDAAIKFVGVWDTVGALGIPLGAFKWFNRRYEFHDVELNPNILNAYHALAIDERRRPFAPTLWQLPEGSGQTLEQVWFAGVHTNVGGGYDNDGLANVPLHWMKEKAQAHGLEVDESFLRPYKPWFGDELRDSMSWKYLLMGPISRPIGAVPRGNESVHQSAIDRFNEIEDYRPENLRSYLEQRPA